MLRNAARRRTETGGEVMSLYYDKSEYFTLRSRYPALMSNLQRFIVTTEYHRGFDVPAEIEPVIKRRHAQKLAHEISLSGCTTVTKRDYFNVVTTEVFICTPLEFWQAVEQCAQELERNRNQLNAQAKP
jgi:hypothetical protein